MRQGHNKRMRGRNRKGPNPLARSYESNGPDVKIRGTALHIAEKYIMLARDAQSSGDRVGEQSYLQHAEHYYRIVAAAQAQMPQQPQMVRQDEGDDDEFDDRGGGQGYDRPMQQGGDNRQPAYGTNDPQPYVNGAPFNGHRELPAQGTQVMDADEGAEGEEGGFAEDGGQENYSGLDRTLGIDRGGGERQPMNDRQPQGDRPQGNRPQGDRDRNMSGGEGGGGDYNQYRSRRRPGRNRPRREGEFNQNNQPQQPPVPVTEE